MYWKSIKHFLFLWAIALMWGGCLRADPVVAIRTNQIANSTNDGSVSLGSFSVLGVSGGTDGNVNAWFTDTGNPTISWQPSSGATSYQIAIYEYDGTTLRCGPFTTSSTSYSFPGCSVPLGSTASATYKASVIAQGGGCHITGQ